MIFVLSYDRQLESLIEQMTFEDEDDQRARDARLAAEARHAGHDNIEVVFLRSASHDDLQRTHSRYFQSTKQIADELRLRVMRQ